MGQVARQHLRLVAHDRRRDTLRAIANDERKTDRFFFGLTCAMFGAFGMALAIGLMTVIL